MSNALLTAVFDLHLSSIYERMVLVRLADRTNDKTGTCWPSVASLADDCCCSVRKVQGVLKELEKRGLIEVERNAGPKGCSLYRLKLPPAADAPPHEVRPSTAGTQPPHATPPPPARGAAEPKRNPKKTFQRAKPNPVSVSEENMTIQAIREGKRYAVFDVSAHQARIWISEEKISEQEAKNVGLL